MQTRQAVIKQNYENLARYRRLVKGLILVVTLVAGCSITLSQSDYITPDENLIVEGIPKIPVSIAKDYYRYGEVQSAAFQGWHPQRREMLVTTRSSQTLQIHEVKLPGGEIKQLTSFPDGVSEAFYEPGAGNSFLFLKDKDGNEVFQIYRYDFSTGASTLLTDGKSPYFAPKWSPTGKWMVFGSNRRSRKDMDLYIMDPRDPKSVRMLAQLEGADWYAVDFSSDERNILVWEYIAVGESNLWIMDASTGQKTLITPKRGQKPVANSDGRFSKDGKGVFMLTDQDSEFLRLAYIDLATKTIRFLTKDISWDVEQFDLNPDGKSIAYTINEEGVSRLHLIEAVTGRELHIPALPVGVITYLKWHHNGRDLGFTNQTARYPNDVFSIDVRKGKIERWTASKIGGLNTTQFTDAELIHWKTFDGKTLSGFLYKPSARFKGPYPVIIVFHGGPQYQARPIFSSRNNYFINELGVAIITPNIRGSTGFGKTFEQLDDGTLRINAIRDGGSLLDWLRNQPNLDADRVLVSGESYGGYMSLAVAAMYNNRINGAVGMVAYSNLVTFMANADEWDQAFYRREFGDERDPKMRVTLEKLSPLNQIDKIKKPLFIITGLNDRRVVASESIQMLAAAKKNGVTAWYIGAKDEGHGFTKKKNRDFMSYALTLFIREFLINLKSSA